MNKISVHNGERVDVTLPDFEGKAGFQVEGSRPGLSYMPNRNGEKLKPGATVQVAGMELTIYRIARSGFVPGMVTIEFDPLPTATDAAD